MDDNAEHDQAGPQPKRGEAAWKAATEQVAARNDDARKAAKQLRQANEREAAVRRRAAELRERADLRGLGS